MLQDKFTIQLILTGLITNASTSVTVNSALSHGSQTLFAVFLLWLPNFSFVPCTAFMKCYDRFVYIPFICNWLFSSCIALTFLYSHSCWWPYPYHSTEIKCPPFTYIMMRQDMFLHSTPNLINSSKHNMLSLLCHTTAISHSRSNSCCWILPNNAATQLPEDHSWWLCQCNSSNSYTVSANDKHARHKQYSSTKGSKCILLHFLTTQHPWWHCLLCDDSQCYYQMKPNTSHDVWTPIHGQSPNQNLQ